MESKAIDFIPFKSCVPLDKSEFQFPEIQGEVDKVDLSGLF